MFIFQFNRLLSLDVSQMCNNLHRLIEINKIGMFRRCVGKKSANSLSVKFWVVLP